MSRWGPAGTRAPPLRFASWMEFGRAGKRQAQYCPGQKKDLEKEGERENVKLALLENHRLGCLPASLEGSHCLPDILQFSSR